MEDYSNDKPSFWGAMAVPWEGMNPLKVGAMSFVLSCCIMGVVFLILHLLEQDDKPIPLVLLLLPLTISAATAVFLLPVRFMVNRLARRLKTDATLQSDCMIVSGMIEAPGVVQIVGDQLAVRPVVGREIRLELSQIVAISELRYFNGRPYWGTAGFFKLSVPEHVGAKWRLGFGVANAEPWRKVLPLGERA